MKSSAVKDEKYEALANEIEPIAASIGKLARRVKPSNVKDKKLLDVVGELAHSVTSDASLEAKKLLVGCMDIAGKIYEYMRQNPQWSMRTGARIEAVSSEEPCELITVEVCDMVMECLRNYEKKDNGLFLNFFFYCYNQKIVKPKNFTNVREKREKNSAADIESSKNYDILLKLTMEKNGCSEKEAKAMLKSSFNSKTILNTNSILQYLMGKDRKGRATDKKLSCSHEEAARLYEKYFSESPAKSIDIPLREKEISSLDKQATKDYLYDYYLDVQKTSDLCKLMEKAFSMAKDNNERKRLQCVFTMKMLQEKINLEDLPKEAWPYIDKEFIMKYQTDGYSQRTLNDWLHKTRYLRIEIGQQFGRILAEGHKTGRNLK